MRSYPANSPQAAARLVVLAMLADGHLCPSEIEALHRLDAFGRLGLSPADVDRVLHDVCEDLLAQQRLHWSEVCRIEPFTLERLLAEVEEPALRRTVLALCVGVVEADRHIAEGESIVVGTAVEQWGLQRAMLEPRAAGAAH